MEYSTKKIFKMVLMILSIMIGILLPVLIIAWGMKWKWTSFAPGTADGWLGFLGWIYRGSNRSFIGGLNCLLYCS